jgi:hypothetical protein
MTIQHQKEDSKHSDHLAQLNIASTSTILPNAEASPRNRCLTATLGTSEADQDMADLTSPPSLNQVRPSTRVETRPTIAHPQTEQPNFGYRMATPHQIYLSVANANPFTALGALSPEAKGPKDAQGNWERFGLSRQARSNPPGLSHQGKLCFSLQLLPQYRTLLQGVEERERAPRFTVPFSFL